MDIIDGAPLLVCATEEEARYAPADLPLLITGMGTVACAVRLTRALTQAEGEGRKPSRLVNFGTAGALKNGLNGIFEISSVYKHDFDSDILEQITAKPCPNRMLVEVSGSFPTARLATGDRFVNDSELRTRLAGNADLVEMEGAIVAWIGREYDIPVTLLKQVSDRADEEAPKSWAAAVDAGAMELGKALLKVVR
ncbi:Aminodeoxyfutalosine nucleosidase [Corynebacterium occultum]|uniref:Aminodeoxyfutalosine nucleosidase n=1 Tax=Corynebacterium occultum TaxID=2675219 RepID=A0A6B8WEL6_9CORY|nr:nucleosidase [Corynebacterium occultum]QGU08430.1 Aminodeoxyfutalosine nucleosidase [Corynebacterium occultum]